MNSTLFIGALILPLTFLGVMLLLILTQGKKVCGERIEQDVCGENVGHEPPHRGLYGSIWPIEATTVCSDDS